jgi:hypothetical protein
MSSQVFVNPNTELDVSATLGVALIRPNYINIEPSGNEGKSFATGITGSSNLKYDVFFDRAVWGKKIRFVP